VDFSSSSVSVSEGGGGGASSAGLFLRSLLKIPILWRIEEVGDEGGDGNEDGLGVKDVGIDF